MNTVIKIEHLSKKYKLKIHPGYLTFRDTLMNLLELPVNLITKKKTREPLQANEFWALKDISFNIKQGEVIGIIGPNGAGKSTLLKILTGVTEPTAGQATVKGKVGSLLEVGTGFHPELSGRENIFLNGAILGMKKKEINKKLDDIIAFAEVEKYIDMPIKRYSSGMQVRLAFAVAAHLNPDILLIDEVLAVGDASFRRKCLGKMEEAATKGGKTILFVSHNLEAIQRLCQKTILLYQGKILEQGETSKVINTYLSQNANINALIKYPGDHSKTVQITEISILDKTKKHSARMPMHENFFISVKYKVVKPIDNVYITASFFDQDELLLFSCDFDKVKKLNNYTAGEYQTAIAIPAYLFAIGQYNFKVGIYNNRVSLDHKQNINFDILNFDDIGSPMPRINRGGKIAVLLDYKTTKISHATN